MDSWSIAYWCCFFLTKNEPFCNLCKWYKSINERFLVHNWIILYLHDIDGHHDDAIYLTLYILWLLLVFLGVFFHFNYAESLNCWLICTFRFHWVFLHFFPHQTVTSSECSQSPHTGECTEMVFTSLVFHFRNDRRRILSQFRTIKYPKCHDECKDVPMWAVRSFFSEHIIIRKIFGYFKCFWYFEVKKHTCNFVTDAHKHPRQTDDHQTKQRHKKYNFFCKWQNMTVSFQFVSTGDGFLISIVRYGDERLASISYWNRALQRNHVSRVLLLKCACG